MWGPFARIFRTFASQLLHFWSLEIGLRRECLHHKHLQTAPTRGFHLIYRDSIYLCCTRRAFFTSELVNLPCPVHKGHLQVCLDVVLKRGLEMAFGYPNRRDNGTTKTSFQNGPGPALNSWSSLPCSSPVSSSKALFCYTAEGSALEQQRKPGQHSATEPRLREPLKTSF